MALADLISENKESKKKGISNKHTSEKPSFKKLIDSYLKNRNDFSPFSAKIIRNEEVGFHPSGLTDACTRSVAFGYLHEKALFKKSISEAVVERKKDSRVELLFDFGHLIHMLIQFGYLPKIKGLKYHVEVSNKGLFEKYLISGTVDIEVLLQDGNWYVVDIKTISIRAFYKLSHDYIEENYPHYISQLNLYMKGRKIHRGILFFVCKDNSDVKEFFFKFNESNIKNELQTALKAKAFIQGSNPPEILKQCIRKTGVFGKCPFKHICFKVQNKTDLKKLLNKSENKK